MKNSFKEGIELLKDSFAFLNEHPIFLAPIFFVWIINAIVTLYVVYFWQQPEKLLISFISEILAFLFIISFAVAIANIMMLEFIEQIERGQKPSFIVALKEAIVKDLIKAAPIAILWAIIWFILATLDALLSRGLERDARPQFSLRNAARTLAGVDRPFSWWNLSIAMLQKLVRMALFLALPAIAWENKGPAASLKRAIYIIRTHPTYFISAYSLTLIAIIIIVLPLAILFWLDDMGAVFPDYVWALAIFYFGTVWTLNIYLEQMMVGMLYLWHLKWEKSGRSGPLATVSKPHLLDNIHEFVELEKLERSL